MMTLNIHEIFKDRLEVIHSCYKGKEVDIIFRSDDDYTDYGGTTKIDNIVENVKAIISPPNNFKDWGNPAIVAAADLEAIIWEDKLKPMLVEQFFETDNYDNIKVLIGNEYYRIIEIRSPEDVDSEIPYWDILLRKLEHSPTTKVK